MVTLLKARISCEYHKALRRPEIVSIWADICFGELLPLRIVFHFNLITKETTLGSCPSHQERCPTVQDHVSNLALTFQSACSFLTQKKCTNTYPWPVALRAGLLSFRMLHRSYGLLGVWITQVEKKNERRESLYHKEQHVLCVHLSNLSTCAICHSEGKITFGVRVKVWLSSMSISSKEVKFY